MRGALAAALCLAAGPGAAHAGSADTATAAAAGADRTAEAAVPIERDERPRWEMGLGGGFLGIPYYRGAEENRNVVFPLVLPIYRGRFVQVDDQGVSGLVYSSPRVELGVSADATLPGDSDDIDLRRGMPDLDLVVQAGPALKILLWRKAEGRRSLLLSFPVRFGFAVDSGFDSIGETFSPHLTWHRDVDWLRRTWRLGLSGGLEFGSNGTHDYYYAVAPQFATAARPAYDADGGFGGGRAMATFLSTGRRTWLSLFARYDRVDGAVFEDSPLIGRRDGWTVGGLFSYSVLRSKQMVRVPPRGYPGRPEQVP